jgi:hypothetical protein
MAVKVTTKKSSGGEEDSIALDVRRFHLPGVVLSSKCPTCKKMIKSDLGADYLSYPSTNTPTDVHFYCPDDDAEWDEQIVLRVTVEPAP